MEQAEAFLGDQITQLQRSLIPPTLKTAYEAAALVIKENAVFNTPSAIDNHGRIIQWSVDQSLERLIKTGKWPFDYRWRYFSKPTGRYLEILPSHCVLTVSQVADHKKQPRDARFRMSKRMSGQGWLAGIPVPEHQRSSSGLPHVLLMHGYRQPNFAFLAMPNKEHEKGFYHKTANLMLMPHAISQTEPPVENTDFELVMTLKEEIDRWRRDNDGQ